MATTSDSTVPTIGGQNNTAQNLTLIPGFTPPVGSVPSSNMNPPAPVATVAAPSGTTAPITAPAINTTTAPVASTAAGQNGTSATTQTISYNPAWASRGITQQIWDSLNAYPSQQAAIGMGLEAGSSLVATTGATVTFTQALNAAMTDPTILSKYSDSLNIDKAQLTQSLSQIQTALNTTNQNNQIQFQNDRTNLAAAYASAGAASSSYRQEAQKNLETQESGIVTSTSAQAQQQLNQLQQTFEAKYGTAATPNLTLQNTNPDFLNPVGINGLNNTNQSSATPLNGAMIGNTVVPGGAIVGTQQPAENQDIANQFISNYSIGQQKATVQPSVSSS